MARVLICEPHDDIAALLELVVRRLGHEPVTHCGGEGEVDAIGIDAAVIEPGEPGGFRIAQRLAGHGVPVLFTSIFPADHAMLELQPVAYLVKPFPLYALERALVAALAAQAGELDPAELLDAAGLLAAEPAAPAPDDAPDAADLLAAEPDQGMAADTAAAMLAAEPVAAAVSQ